MARHDRLHLLVHLGVPSEHSDSVVLPRASMAHAWPLCGRFAAGGGSAWHPDVHEPALRARAS